jgi:hypothetical protein
VGADVDEPTARARAAAPTDAAAVCAGGAAVRVGLERLVGPEALEPARFEAGAAVTAVGGLE